MLTLKFHCAAFAAAALIATTRSAVAQDPAPVQDPPGQVHDMSKMDMPMDMDMSDTGWHLMQDGSLYLLVNRQGGPRGGSEVRAPNWWMGMASRKLRGGDLTLTGMFSLDPATVGARGYRELFQVGEALDGKAIVDRQHPHDAWMQISAAWRRSVAPQTGLTLAGGVSGEPALGPVAFMHRASAAAIPFAPLGHHTFDSTHVAFGVVTAGIDHGPIAVEASLFNGREPDGQRWDIDFGRLDSVSGRVWYRPSRMWEFQLSSGRLVEPEQLHHGNVIRTTTSASYMAGDDAHRRAVTIGVGMNATEDVTRRAAFGEATAGWGRLTASIRAEIVEVETELLRLRELPGTLEGEARRDRVGAFTVGAQRVFASWRGVTAAVGANTTMYYVPSPLISTHGAHPISFQVFVQLRPPVGAMGRMWNMRMAGPPMAEGMSAPHQH